jgi:hypothetical protein
VREILHRHPAVAAAAAALLLGLVVALVSHFGTANRVRRTLFFPRLAGQPPAQTVRYAGEERRVPVRRGLEARVAGVVEEILLGPEDPRNRALVSPGTYLLSVAAADGTVYVSLSAGLLNEGSVVPPEKQVQAVADTIYYNFPSVRLAHVLIDGQPPDFSRAAGDRAYDFRAGVPRSRLLTE